MQKVYAQTGGDGEGESGAQGGIPGMSGMGGMGGMGGMPGGFDPSQMEEMLKSLSPEQRSQMEAMAANMAKPSAKNGGPKVEEVD